jgi:WD40 repeat protein
MRILEGHDGIITSIAFAPDGMTLVSAATRGPALFWDLGGPAAPRPYPDANSSVVIDGLTRVAWSQQPDTVALGHVNGSVDIVSLAGQLQTGIENNIIAPVTGLAFFGNGRYLITCCGGVDEDSGAIMIADRDKKYARIAGTSSGTSFGAAAATPRGKVCYYVDSKRRVFRWDLTATDQRRTNNFTKSIRALALSPDGHTFAATDDYAIHVYDADTMQRLRTLTGHQGLVDALTFTPDGRLLASGAWDKTVRFWDVEAGREIAAHDWDIGQVRTIAFSPDGLLGAAAGDRGAIVLWDMDQ